jgi:uncharacterized protein
MMKILIDVNHPAHVHYFRNFYHLMTLKGHEITITSRDMPIITQLLEHYNIKHDTRNKRPGNIYKKIFYILRSISFILRISIKKRPDLYLSYASFFTAATSFFFRRPHVAFDDTEHNSLNHFISSPFTDCFITPSSFNISWGGKQIRYHGFMELCYLHKKYFSPNKAVLKLLPVDEYEKYIIIRFVSWDAAHDRGQSGFSPEEKVKLVTVLSDYAKIFISSEGDLPEVLKKYELRTSPDQIHDVLSYATLYIGEGATMASECTMLGTPAIYVNSLDAGTLQEQERFGLLFGYRNPIGVIEKAVELLQTPNIKNEFQLRREKMLADKIDVTAFMVWFIENYPESKKIMKKNPDYQFNFR